ncbi:hypothetical protein C1645_816466 [Glomus cerebriforme]|uniref:C2H2-type domain-containing protein n=1 Tax=Glomus cerebriforme TaxID=658196 RepID=A0A397TGR7_9GLOM|nr:hypothetical protein C1645_816466 [Glomus cerebriforme]
MNMTSPLSPLLIINEFKCIVCEKQFKSKCGLSRYKSIVRKYNEIPEQEKIPNFLTNKFKEDIPRYSYGEVTVEWKQKKDTDAEGNVCQGGFMLYSFRHKYSSKNDIRHHLSIK